MASSGAIGVGGIGSFVIGGDSYDWEATVISQYANSPKLKALIGSFAVSVDQKADIDAFYDDLWNIDTAFGYGLEVWGRIVVVNRTLQINSRYFGFDEGNANSDYDPFNQSPFYPGGGTTTSYRLQDDAFRILILAKALANITYGSVPGINSILQLLFPGRGPVYVEDNGNMQMTYVFGFIPTPVEVAIVQTSNVMPKPTGVKVNYVIPT
jgi:hypothetical protein